MRIVLLFLLLLLSGCYSNEIMCEFTPPDQMTDRQLEFCKAMYSGVKIINNNTIKQYLTEFFKWYNLSLGCQTS